MVLSTATMPSLSTSSMNRYSSYTSSYPSYSSYCSSPSSTSTSSYLNRTTSLDRSAYPTKVSSSAGSSNYYNNSSRYKYSSSRFSSALPPRPTYTSAIDNYRNSRSLRDSPIRSWIASDITGGISDISKESRYSVNRYRESSASRDSGYSSSSRYRSRDRLYDTPNDCLRRRLSIDHAKDILNDDDKVRISDRIRLYEITKTDPTEERLAERRRRLGFSPVRDITVRSYRYSAPEENGNDSDTEHPSVSDLCKKYGSNLNLSNGSSSSGRFYEVNGCSGGAGPSYYSRDITNGARPSSYVNSSLRNRLDSTTSDDSKSTSSDIILNNIRPSSPIVKPYSSSTESIISSLKEPKIVSRPISPTVKEYDAAKRVTGISLADNREDYRTLENTKRERASRIKSRIAARLAGESEDNDDVISTRKRSPTGSSTGSFNENNGLVGLRNIGNTCFMNSILQCLSNTPCLMEYLVREGYSTDINTTLSTMKGDLITAFANLMLELWRDGGSDSRSAINTCSFKMQIQKFAPVFLGYSQHDAQEFLRKLLEGLHEDVNRVTTRPNPIIDDIDESFDDDQKAMESWKRYLRYDNSKIVDMFVGQLMSSLQCSVCSHRSVTFDPFWDLCLAIPSRTGQVKLSQCLDLFTKEEVLDNDERPTCARCKERRKMTKSFTIQKFPKILVLHLKRFSPTERWRGKLGCMVEFPLENLNLSRYASSSNNSCRYSLIGVANHSGTALSGHYTAYCRHPYMSTWHEYNDSRLSSISSNRVCSPEAYVLFYELTSS